MRLIDADELLAEYDRVHVGEPGGARKLIEGAPTIPLLHFMTRPVVMCKDCEHYRKSLYPYTETGYRGVCELIEYIMDGYYSGAQYRDPWDYCSQGERRMCNATD